jgi:hypothetical protein
VSTTLADAIAKAKADAAAVNTSKSQVIGGGITAEEDGAAVGIAAASVKTSSRDGMGDVARSAAAASSDIGERQLAILEQIRDALSGPSDETLVDFAGA